MGKKSLIYVSQMSLNFAIIGVSGYITKKQFNVIKNLNHNLVLACDICQNVSYYDSFFPECKFVTNLTRTFFSFIQQIYK